MLAAWFGRDAAVARLLALGADVGLGDRGRSALHLACGGGDHSSVLALLLDAGASANAPTNGEFTPLMMAATFNSTRCVALLIDRGGAALDLNAKSILGCTALYAPAVVGHADIVQLLLQGGADPTIPDKRGDTALNAARRKNHQCCVLHLEAALIEPQRSRLLFKARALLDAAHATNKARTIAQTKGHPAVVQEQAAMAAAPVYLKQRVEQAQELPESPSNTIMTRTRSWRPASSTRWGWRAGAAWCSRGRSRQWGCCRRCWRSYWSCWYQNGTRHGRGNCWGRGTSFWEGKRRRKAGGGIDGVD